jgi:glutamate N-acetyltransferase / amino-acid N-acetyltransferase
MTYSVIDDGHVSSPDGFRATGVSAGLKEIRARDLALVYSQRPCRAAALFTTNAITAAPVYFDQAVLARNRESIRAVLVNAGHANAGTGQAGLQNAVECAKIAADELEVPRDSVLLLSTGQIGVALPMDKMREGIRRAASELDSSGGKRAAIAILTGDTRPKDRALRVTLREGRGVTLAGMAKGSRMMQPQLATLLAVVTTDAPIESRLLHRALEQSAARSFGRLAIGGDSSPNDGLILLANGSAGGPPVGDPNSYEFGAFQEALDYLCGDLAQQVAREAASNGKLIHIHVRGAASEATARQVALTVARSSSVRWAYAKGTPDWGGLLVAVGASGVELRPEALELRLGAVTVMADGTAARFDQSALVQAISGPEVELTVDLHIGASAATVWTCTTPMDGS